MYKPLITALISAGLAGLGAPLLQQLRELIKDIWFRNKEESKNLALENEAKRSAIEQGHSSHKCRHQPPGLVLIVMVVNCGRGNLQKTDRQLALAAVRDGIEKLLKQAL
jgi:hypothetical protein